MGKRMMISAILTINLFVVRVIGRQSQTDLQFNDTLNLALRTINDISPVSITIRKIKTIPDRHVGTWRDSPFELYSWWRLYSKRRGWMGRRNDLVLLSLPPLRSPISDFPMFGGLSTVCALRHSWKLGMVTGISIGWVTKERVGGGETRHCSATVYAHELLHALGAGHVWGTPNLMDTAAGAYCTDAIPPVIREFTVPQVIKCERKRGYL